MPKLIQEQAALTEAVNKKTGKILVDIVTPGVGSSGYYSPEVCEAAAGLVQPGTQMFIDHPTELEAMERPIRSVKDIAAVFTESARWDPNRGENGSLVAEAQVVPAWVETMGVIQGAIGVSLRGSATDIVEGDRPDGSRGRIVEGLHAIESVDFVTRAGRGGAFALLEAAQPSRVNSRAVGHGVAEATVNDTREALQTALRDAHATAKDVWLYVRDFDDSTVWFELEGSGAGDAAGIYGQDYTEADGAVTLTGDRTEVRVVTKYVPTTRSDSTTTTESQKEIPMGKIQVEESEHTDALAKAGRVDVLEAENATLKETIAGRDRTDRARVLIGERIAEAKVEAFTDLEQRGLLADLPLTESGEFDEAAFTAAVDKQLEGRTAVTEAIAGPSGFGASVPTGGGTGVTESTRPTRTAWGRELQVKGA